MCGCGLAWCWGKTEPLTTLFFCPVSGLFPQSLLVSQHRLSVANTHPSCTISVFNTESFPRSPLPRQVNTQVFAEIKKKKKKQKAPRQPQQPVFNEWKTRCDIVEGTTGLISERVHDVSKSMSPRQAWKKKGKKKRDAETTQLTECHLAGFAQLWVVSLFHLLVGQDLFQSSCQEHVFRLFALKHVAPEFGARCAWSQWGGSGVGERACSRLER